MLPGSAASHAEPALRNGDKIVRIDDTPISEYGQIDAALAKKADKPITLVVERVVNDAQGKPTSTTQRIPITVPPNPMRQLGLVMTMGQITAVQAGSPAAAAGIKPGDQIDKVDGRPAGDPMKLARSAAAPGREDR